MASVTSSRSGSPFTIMGDVTRDLGYKPGIKCCALTCAGSVFGLALFIIGCIGASGGFAAAPAIGGAAIGLSVVGFALTLAQGNFKKRTFELVLSGLMAAAFITVGALGAAGVLTATQVGWGIVGTILCTMFVSCMKGYYLGFIIARRMFN